VVVAVVVAAVVHIIRIRANVTDTATALFPPITAYIIIMGSTAHPDAATTTINILKTFLLGAT
jgi:hypothetical protein